MCQNVRMLDSVMFLFDAILLLVKVGTGADTI